MLILASYYELDYSFKKLMNYAQALYKLNIAEENLLAYEKASNDTDKAKYYDTAARFEQDALIQVNDAQIEFSEHTAIITNAEYDIEGIINTAFQNYKNPELRHKYLTDFTNAGDKGRLVMETIKYAHMCIEQVELADRSTNMSDKAKYSDLSVEYGNKAIELFTQFQQYQPTILDDYFKEAIYDYSAAYTDAASHAQEMAAEAAGLIFDYKDN